MAEDDFLDFKCPYCGLGVAYPEARVGVTEECPGCFQTFIVPNPGDEKGRPLPLPIKTPSLVLRRFDAQDWEGVLEFASDEELMRYGSFPPLDEESVVDWLTKDRSARFTEVSSGLWLGIELVSAHKLIGGLWIGFQDDTRVQGSFWIVINRQFHRKGYGTEATRALIDFWLHGLQAHRVTASTDVENIAGRRLLEKAGLRREGEFIQDQLVNNEWVSTAYYALLASEYRRPG